MDVNRHQEVEKICREVFEDTVKQACGKTNQPSNQYSAALRKLHQDGSVFLGFAYRKIQVAVDALKFRPPEDTCKVLLNTLRRQIDSWEHVVVSYVHLFIHSRSLCGRAELDAERVISMMTEHCLQPLLNVLVPWIVSRGGGWEDFRNSPYGPERT